MLRAIILSLISAVLLVLAYPSFHLWPLIWIGLIPLLIALDGKNKKQAFALGYLCGFLFFGGTLYWFIHVTLPGAILLIAYLSLYFALFALGYVSFRTCGEPLRGTLDESHRDSSSLDPRPRSPFAKQKAPWPLVLATSAMRLSTSPLIIISSLWVCLEFIRAKFLSGFGWVCLGHSQYQILPLIQMTDVTGIYGLSFVIVMVNVWLKNFFVGQKHIGLAQSKFVVGILILILGYGFFQIKTQSLIKPSATVKVSVIQANIPQSLKWDPQEWKETFQKYLLMTRQASEDSPDLIIWPETAFPGYVWENPQQFEDLKDFIAKLQIPLLFGMVTMEGEKYYNSAVLLSKEGDVAEKYDKLHLVAFGEYLPLRKILSLLEGFILIPSADFTAGEKLTLFPLDLSHPGLKFSVLICFEDTLSYVSRRLVNHGADVLVNITNDAWFHDTNAPFLHLQAAIFEAVENRRPLIRAANTGVSCFIDPLGRIRRSLAQKMGRETYVAGNVFERMDVAQHRPKTFYTKFGDVFTYLCFFCILIIVFRKIRHYKTIVRP
ncbi:MAG: apolipoprotein N-acyltransferase [Candidatus Omnitrophica bacterium]|nr:apolipoprotein N-acyltransferase [Candidatus Omnitrophota bacterium]